MRQIEESPRLDLATELASRLYNAPLAIAADHVQLILHARIDTEDFRVWMTEETSRVEARASGLGIEDSSSYANVNGVAIVPVTGSLFRSAFFSDYDSIQATFDAALSDPDVSSILLEVDSPGGEVRGMFDLADHIFQARGEKPIWALANDQMTSAAYAIGSSADRVIASRSSVLGSIGVVAIHVDESAAAEKSGVKFTEISSGKLKTELSSTKPLSALGRQILTKHVQNSAEQFFSLVSRNRGISVGKVRAQEAGLFFPDLAVKSGLADEVLDRTAVIKRMGFEAQLALSGKSTNTIPSAAAAAELTQDEEVSPMSQEISVDPEVPDVADDEVIEPSPVAATEVGTEDSGEIIDLEKAREDARAEVRADAKAIGELCSLAGQPQRAVEFIAEGLTADQARARLLADQAAATSSAVSNAVDPNESAARPVIDTAAIYRKRAERTQRG